MDNDRKIGRPGLAFETLDQLAPLHIRQHKIDDNAIKSSISSHFQRLFRRSRGAYLEIFARQQFDDAVTQGVVILDEQQPLLRLFYKISQLYKSLDEPLS